MSTGRAERFRTSSARVPDQRDRAPACVYEGASGSECTTAWSFVMDSM